MKCISFEDLVICLDKLNMDYKIEGKNIIMNKPNLTKCSLYIFDVDEDDVDA